MELPIRLTRDCGTRNRWAIGSSMIEYALKLFDKLPEAKSQRPADAMVTSHGIAVSRLIETSFVLWIAVFVNDN